MHYHGVLFSSDLYLLDFEDTVPRCILRSVEDEYSSIFVTNHLGFGVALLIVSTIIPSSYFLVVYPPPGRIVNRHRSARSFSCLDDTNFSRFAFPSFRLLCPSGVEAGTSPSLRQFEISSSCQPNFLALVRQVQDSGRPLLLPFSSYEA